MIGAPLGLLSFISFISLCFFYLKRYENIFYPEYRVLSLFVMFSTTAIIMSTFNLIQDLGLSSWLLIVFVDARWIETRFDFTAYNMFVSSDFHGKHIMIKRFLFKIRVMLCIS